MFASGLCCPWTLFLGVGPWRGVTGAEQAAAEEAEEAEEAEDTFRLGLSGLRMVKDSVDSFRPERTKLMVMTYSVSERRPLNVVLLLVLKKKKINLKALNNLATA